jgi:hypothetical protein
VSTSSEKRCPGLDNYYLITQFRARIFVKVSDGPGILKPVAEEITAQRPNPFKASHHETLDER